MKKTELLKLTPASIRKMGEKEVRRAYSEARSILRKRNERIESAGFKSIYKTPEPVKNVAPGSLKNALADVTAALRGPMSSVQGVRARLEKISKELAGHKWDIPPEKLDDFGRFMEATRKRQKATYKGKSGVAATAYTELRKAGVSGKTIERSFKKWLENTEKMDLLVTAAQNAYSTHPGKRVTSAELSRIMGELD